MIEYRTALGSAEESEGTVNGLVTPFNVKTVIGDLRSDGFKEDIAPGAFKKTLQERDIVFLWNHNKDMPLARTSAGNLDLREDPSAGLRASATPVDTSYAQDLLKLTKAGVVKGMSFGFEVIRDSWTDDDGRAADMNTGTNRTIHEVRLHEVSAVTFPAYETTSFSARDAISAARSPRGSRAAKAAYADLRTCAGCGSTEEWGSYCSGCGEPMDEPQIQPAFCSDCGSPLGDERASHVCTEKRDVVGNDTDHAGVSLALLQGALSDLVAAGDQVPAVVASAITSLNAAKDHLSKHIAALPPGTNAPDSPSPVSTGNTHMPADSSPQNFGFGRSMEPASTTPDSHAADLARAAQIEALMRVTIMEMPV